MKKVLKIAFIALLPLFMIGCSNDDDNMSEENQYYDLMITNETANEIEIYLNVTTDSRGFVNNGNIAAGENALITDLEANVPYIIRAANAGEELEDFFIEIPFENSNTEQQSIVIEN
ncbi:hypothetical protein [Zunongwangia sp. H14]|uniref:hypothetical protein n=1 Tax=Zunongwangia sp. H14 TaxID=3240792 RepID=UPI00356756FE